MKNVEIDAAIRSDPDLLAAVMRANELLLTELGRSADEVSASWALSQDLLGKPVVRLVLLDANGDVSVEYQFGADEFKSDWHLQGRMIRLWGDLLERQSHRLIEEMQRAQTSGEGW